MRPGVQVDDRFNGFKAFNIMTVGKEQIRLDLLCKAARGVISWKSFAHKSIFELLWYDLDQPILLGT